VSSENTFKYPFERIEGKWFFQIRGCACVACLLSMKFRIFSCHHHNRDSGFDRRPDQIKAAIVRQIKIHYQCIETVVCEYVPRACNSARSSYFETLADEIALQSLAQDVVILYYK